MVGVVTGVRAGGEERGSGGGIVLGEPEIDSLPVPAVIADDAAFMYRLYFDDRLVGRGGNGGGTIC